MADAVTMSATSYDQAINIEQNSSRSIEFLQAAHAAHTIAQRWENIRLTIALLLSTGALLSATIHFLAPVTTCIGVAGSIVLWLLTYVSQNQTKVASQIQEEFDVELFGIDHAKELRPYPTAEEIKRLAQKSRATVTAKSDWYVDVTDLPLPYAVLLCQRENLNWDWPLRRKWAGILSGSAIVWLLAGIAIALIADWTTRDLFLRWIGPSLPGLLLAATQAVGNRKVAREKQQLALEIDEDLGVLPTIAAGDAIDPTDAQMLMTKCRHRQDQIFQLRNHAERVPNWLYRRTKHRDEEIARNVAERIRARLRDHA
jgi:hypothetical protein